MPWKFKETKFLLRNCESTVGRPQRFSPNLGVNSPTYSGERGCWENFHLGYWSGSRAGTKATSSNSGFLKVNLQFCVVGKKFGFL